MQQLPIREETERDYQAGYDRVIQFAEYSHAQGTLDFSNPLELLIATELAAQSTDERVNMVSRDLFRKYRSVEDYATVSEEELEQDIRSTGFYRNKAKNIRAASQRIITNYG